MRRFFVWLLLLLLPVHLSSQTLETTPLAIKNVSVIDMTGAPAKPNMTVVIDGGRITQIGRSSRVRIPKNAKVVDGKAKFLIPSLWDMHVPCWSAWTDAP